MASTEVAGRTTLGYGPHGQSGPFGFAEMDRLAEALTVSSRETGINFSVYIGDLGSDRRATLANRHASFGAQAANTCLIAVSPNEKAIEIGVGQDAARRINDRACNLAVASMASSFQGGDLPGGLVNAIRLLSDQAGRPA